MSTESMPATVIWTGIATAVCGALFIVFAPIAVNIWMTPNTDAWQSGFIVVDVLVQIARAVLPPLGAALIAAGLVMLYVDRRLSGERIADRPRRWHWPEQTR